MRSLAIAILSVGLITGNVAISPLVNAQDKGGKGAEKESRSKEKKKDADGDKSSRSAEKGKKKDADKGPGLRLPRFFASIVDEAQREKILAIRAKHQPKIEDLRKQLMALEKQESEEIEAVLTPAQRKQLDALRSEGGKADAPKEKGKAKPKPKDKDKK